MQEMPDQILHSDDIPAISHTDTTSTFIRLCVVVRCCSDVLACVCWCELSFLALMWSCSAVWSSTLLWWWLYLDSTCSQWKSFQLRRSCQISSPVQHWISKSSRTERRHSGASTRRLKPVTLNKTPAFFTWGAIEIYLLGVMLSIYLYL